MTLVGQTTRCAKDAETKKEPNSTGCFVGQPGGKSETRSGEGLRKYEQRAKHVGGGLEMVKRYRIVSSERKQLEEKPLVGQKMEIGKVQKLKHVSGRFP